MKLSAGNVVEKRFTLVHFADLSTIIPMLINSSELCLKITVLSWASIFILSLRFPHEKSIAAIITC